MSAATARAQGARPPLNPYAAGGPAEEAWRRYTEVVVVHACPSPPPVASYAPCPVVILPTESAA